MSKKKPTFEEALKELEQIAQEIEQGKIGLEESIAKYEQGMALVGQCRQILAQAEQRIQQLHVKDDGTLTAVPFEIPPESGEAENNAARLEP